jgi:glutaredoxin
MIAVGMTLAGVAIYAFYFNRQSPTITPKTDIQLFYGRECPHCQDVEDFLGKNAVADKIAFDSIEVWHNQENEALLLKKAKECGLGEDQVAVPFLYAEKKCFLGTELVESFFKEALEKRE